MPSKPTGNPHGKHLIRKRKVPLTKPAYQLPRSTDGTVRPWVVELARLRSAGWTSTKMLGARLGRHESRIRQVMLDPDYQILEVVESLRLLGTRRSKALTALGDKAEAGDVAAIRLVLELTKVIEPTRPLLIQIANVTGVSVDVNKPIDEPTMKSLASLEAQRDELFTRLFGGQPPVDVIFRDSPTTTNGNGSNGHEAHAPTGEDVEPEDEGGSDEA